MRHLLIAIAASILLSATAAEPPGKPSDAPFAEVLNGLLPELGTAGGDKALAALETAVHRAARPGAEAERTACCRALATALQGEASPLARTVLLRQLGSVGGAESVDAVAALLEGPDARLREEARAALQRMPAPEAAAALRRALAKATEPTWRAALAVALALRREAAVVPAAATLIGDADPVVVETALDALGRIGGDAAVAAARKAPDAARIFAGDVLLRHADDLLRGGRRADAEALFRELAQPAWPRSVRFAALRGALAAQGDEAAPRILQLLAGQDQDSRIAALGSVGYLGPMGRKALVGGLPDLSVEMRAVLIQSLAEAGEKGVLPAALEAIRSPDPATRSAGLDAVSRLGDHADVPTMVGALAKATNAADRALYEQALVRLPGRDAVVSAMVTSTKGADGETLRSLITALALRGNRAAVPALMTLADHPDIAAARAAYRALADLAAAEDAGPLLAKFTANKVRELAGDAENAAARALLKVEPVEDRTAAISAAFDRADNLDLRCALLRLYRVAPEPTALGKVGTALSDPEARIRESALRTLAEWPDAGAWGSLVSVVRAPEKDVHRVLAMRGLARLQQVSNEKKDPSLLPRYRELLALARDADDRKLILAAIGGATDPAALDLVNPMLDDPAVQKEAELAARQIADSIKNSHPQEAAAARKRLKRERQ